MADRLQACILDYYGCGGILPRTPSSFDDDPEHSFHGQSPAARHLTAGGGARRRRCTDNARYELPHNSGVTSRQHTNLSPLKLLVSDTQRRCWSAITGPMKSPRMWARGFRDAAAAVLNGCCEKRPRQSGPGQHDDELNVCAMPAIAAIVAVAESWEKLNLGEDHYVLNVILCSDRYNNPMQLQHPAGGAALIFLATVAPGCESIYLVLAAREWDCRRHRLCQFSWVHLVIDHLMWLTRMHSIVPLRVKGWLAYGPFTLADGTAVLTELLESSGRK